MLSVIGYGVFIALFGGMLRIQARRWRYLAASYAGDAGPSRETRTMQNVVLMGLGGYNSLTGIVTIGVHDTGVSFRVMLPFSLFHDPLFIPHRDIRGWRTSWYLDAESVELDFHGAPEVKMIVSAEQAEWLRAVAGHGIKLHAVEPPDGKAGQGWRAFALVHAGISLVMIAWLSVVWLSQ